MKALRPLGARLIGPLVSLLIALRVTPNALTLAGTAFSLVVAAIVAAGFPELGGGLAILAGAFDMLDGAVARRTGTVSAFGAFLDSTMDRVSDGALLLGIAALAIARSDPTLALAAFGASIAASLVSYTRARAEAVGVAAEVGFMDRPARIALLAAGLLTGFQLVAVGAVLVGAVITSVQRILAVRASLSARDAA